MTRLQRFDALIRARFPYAYGMKLHLVLPAAITLNSAALLVPGALTVTPANVPNADRWAAGFFALALIVALSFSIAQLRSRTVLPTGLRIAWSWMPLISIAILASVFSAPVLVTARVAELARNVAFEDSALREAKPQEMAPHPEEQSLVSLVSFRQSQHSMAPACDAVRRFRKVPDKERSSEPWTLGQRALREFGHLTDDDLEHIRSECQAAEDRFFDSTNNRAITLLEEWSQQRIQAEFAALDAKYHYIAQNAEAFVRSRLGPLRFDERASPHSWTLENPYWVLLLVHFVLVLAAVVSLAGLVSWQVISAALVVVACSVEVVWHVARALARGPWEPERDALVVSWTYSMALTVAGALLLIECLIRRRRAWSSDFGLALSVIAPELGAVLIFFQGGIADPQPAIHWAAIVSVAALFASRYRALPVGSPGFLGALVGSIQERFWRFDRRLQPHMPRVAALLPLATIGVTLLLFLPSLIVLGIEPSPSRVPDVDGIAGALTCISAVVALVWLREQWRRRTRLPHGHAPGLAWSPLGALFVLLPLMTVGLVFARTLSSSIRAGAAGAELPSAGPQQPWSGQHPVILGGTASLTSKKILDKRSLLGQEAARYCSVYGVRREHLIPRTTYGLGTITRHMNDLLPATDWDFERASSSELFAALEPFGFPGASEKQSIREDCLQESSEAVLQRLEARRIQWGARVSDNVDRVAKARVGPLERALYPAEPPLNEYVKPFGNPFRAEDPSNALYVAFVIAALSILATLAPLTTARQVVWACVPLLLLVVLQVPLRRLASLTVSTTSAELMAAARAFLPVRQIYGSVRLDVALVLLLALFLWAIVRMAWTAWRKQRTRWSDRAVVVLAISPIAVEFMIKQPREADEWHQRLLVALATLVVSTGVFMLAARWYRDLPEGDA